MQKIPTEIITAAAALLLLFSQTSEAICGDKPKKYKKHNKTENICEKQARNNTSKWKRKSYLSYACHLEKHKPVLLSGNMYVGSSDFISFNTNALGIGLTFHPSNALNLTFNHYYSAPRLSTSKKSEENICEYVGLSVFDTRCKFLSFGAAAGTTFYSNGNNTLHFGPALRIGHKNRINLTADFPMNFEKNRDIYPSVEIKAVFPLLFGRR